MEILVFRVSSDGMTDEAVCKEASDSIRICLMEKGDWVQFESEAYHLGSWCDLHGFRMESWTVTLDLDKKEAAWL